MAVRTVAKHRYFTGQRAKRSAKEYTNYLCYRRGEDREQGGRQFFDKEREDIRGREVLGRLEDFRQGRGVVAHELMLSPGLNVVDPQEYTRELIEKLERSKGQELDWAAVAHKGDHSHIHVLILGKDENGRPVKINRNDYKDLREWGDRYLEREHSLERVLDRRPEHDRSLDRGKVQDRDRSDELFNSLFGKADRTKERELDKEKDKEPTAPAKEWNKERTIAELDDQEKIYRKNEAYSRFSSLAELKQLDSELRGGSVQRVEKSQYAQLRRWLDEKEKFGEDYHERQEKEKLGREEKERTKDTDRFVREFQELDNRFRERGEIYHPMGRQQRIFEQQGRLSDAHEIFTRNMEENRLTDLMDRDPEHKERYQQQLDDFRRSYRGEPEGERLMPKEQRILEEQGRLSDDHAYYNRLNEEKRLTEAMGRDPENKERYEKELEAYLESYRAEREQLERVDLEKLFGWKDQDRGEDRSEKKTSKDREDGKDEDRDRAEPERDVTRTEPQHQESETQELDQTQEPERETLDADRTRQEDKEREERQEREERERQERERQEREERERDRGDEFGR